jgi:hypothetical protein
VRAYRVRRGRALYYCNGFGFFGFGFDNERSSMPQLRGSSSNGAGQEDRDECEELQPAPVGAEVEAEESRVECEDARGADELGGRPRRHYTQGSELRCCEALCAR